MTINADVQSTSGHTPEEIKEKVEGAAGQIKGKVQDAAGQIKAKARTAAHHVAGRVRGMERYAPSKSTFRSSLLMSGAVLGTVLITSMLRRTNPLETFSMMGEELPFLGERKRRFRTRHVLGGIGSIIGGAMVLTALNHRIGRRVGDRPFVRGALAIASAIGLDSLLMGPSYIGKLVTAIGPAGAVAKYGSLGGAYSLACRGEEEEGYYGRDIESVDVEGDTFRSEPVYSGAEVGTVAGSPERPQPIV